MPHARPSYIRHALLTRLYGLAAAVAAASSASLAWGTPGDGPRFLVLTDPAITCIAKECGCGTSDLVAQLDVPAGTASAMPQFSAQALIAALSAGTTVVVPEQSGMALVDALGTAERAALRAAIAAGGRILVLGDAADHDARLLNALVPAARGEPFASSYAPAFARAAAVPQPFAALVPTLEAQPATYAIGGWKGDEVLFGDIYAAGAAFARVGDGAIGFIASDFSNPDCPGANALGDWIPVTVALANALADHAPGAACNLVGGVNPCGDDDGDLVPNGLDRCPSIAGDAALGGCPAEVGARQPRVVATPPIELLAFGGTAEGLFAKRLLAPAAAGSTVRVRAWVDAPLLQPNQVVTFRIGTRSVEVPDQPGGGFNCGWRRSELAMPAAEFNALLAAEGDAIPFSATTTATTFAGCSFTTYAQFILDAAGEPMAGSDSDGDGQPIEADRCPLAPGSATDNDGDEWTDLNDAYACDPARAAVDAGFSAAELDGFLATASAACVDGTGMTQPKLCVVGDRSASIKANSMLGTFTIRRDVLAHQIEGILSRVQPLESFVGGAVVTIDAAQMADAQLVKVAAAIGCVSHVENLVVTHTLSPTVIAALVAKAAAGEVTVAASGMTDAQLSAAVSGAAPVSITGAVVVGAGVPALRITEIASMVVAGSATVRFETAGMSTQQLAAVQSAIAAFAAANGGTNPFCDTIDVDADGFAADACLASNTDCDDTRFLYVDADGDGFGSNTPAPCGIPQRGDICPSDAAKRTPGFCGCGSPETDSDTDGTPDCAEGRVVLSLAPLAPAASDAPFVVRVQASEALVPGMVYTGLQLAMHFDTEWLELVAVEPIEGGPLNMPIATMIDNGLGTLRYAIGVGPESEPSGAAAGLVDLVFALKKEPLCGRASLLGFRSFGAFGNALAARTPGADGTVVTPVAVDLDNADLDTLPPTLTGVPAEVPEVPVDIGRDDGAFIATAPTVTAYDLCSGALPVSLDVIYPAPRGTEHAWPADGVFPTGETRLVWTATDASGNVSRAERSIVVGPYQLLDVTVTLGGFLQAPTTRNVRIAGSGGGAAWERILEVEFARSNPGQQGSTVSLTGVQIPPRAVQDCILAKSREHSLSDAMAPIASGGRFVTTHVLRQGDCDDTDAVDIYDFSIFVASRSNAASSYRAPNAIANFNADLRIDTVDFSFISLAFFEVGDGCTTGAAGAAPVERVSVKELRRRGLGELAVADLNGDGWVDRRDVRQAIEGGEQRPSVLPGAE